jgi:hypothetical protein
MGCSPTTNPDWADRDDERHPRNAAAIRTALMLGAEFVEHSGRERTYWSIEGLDCSQQSNRATLAYLYLIPFGIGIDTDAKPKLFQDMASYPVSRSNT